MNRFRAASSPLVLLALALTAVSGCCYCGTPLYDFQAHETWNQLERGLHGGPTSVDGEQTGVSIQLPVLFDSKTTKSFRPGGEASIDILPERIQPPGLSLPGLRFTCETIYADTQDRKLPVNCYLAVLAKGNAERTKAKDQLLAAAKASYPTAQWEAATLPGSTLAAEKLSLIGPQKFVPSEATRPDAIIETAGQLDLYLVAAEHANVLVGFRAPVDIAQRVSLFEAAEASIASIKSEKPAVPIAATPGEQPAALIYVQVPNANLELVPPPGFTASTTMSGFEKTGGSNIAVIPQPHPYAAMVKSYQADTLKGYNINVLQQEDVAIAGAPALLLLLERDNPQQTYWNLVFGDDTGSFVVTGTLANASDEVEKQALRAALLTARKKPAHPSGNGEAGTGNTLPGPKVEAADLKEIGLAYHRYVSANGDAAPQKLADLEPLLGGNPKSIEHLAAGRIVFYFGVPLAQMRSGTSSTILAYERDVPAKGGPTLYGDGSVVALSAAEFAAAVKAKP